MQEKKVVPLVAILILICFYTFPIFAETNNPPTKNNNSHLNTSNQIDEKIDLKIKELESKYMKTKLLTYNAYLDRLDSLCNNAEIELNRIWRLLAGVGIIIAILGFMGAGNLIQLYKSTNEAKKNLDETNKLYKKIGDDIFQKSLELRERYGYLTDPSSDETSVTSLDENKFLDYDHQLYFMPIFLPITKDFLLYKESLLKLGIFFVWQHKYARAILRFEEIERITEVEYGSIKYDKQILDEKTDIFFNAYANACSNYAAEKCIKDSAVWRIYIDRAETYYKRAMKMNPYFHKPYHNIGITYAKDKGKPEIALKYYDTALLYAKKPDDIFGIKWNIACSFARMKKKVKEIIEPLERIPPHHAFWKKIQKDEVFDEIKNTPEWRALIKRKCG